MAQLIGDLLIRLAAESSGIEDFQSKMSQLRTTLQYTKDEAAATQKVLNEFKAGTASAAGGFDSLAGSVDKAVNSLGAIATRLAIHTALRDLAQVAGEVATSFKDAENEITRSTGAIGDRLDEFDHSLKNVMSTSVQSADDIGKAMGKIASSLHLEAGPQLEQLTKQILDFSQVTGEAAGNVADKIPKILKAFGDVGSAGAVLQRIADVSQSTNTSISTLTDNLQKFGPAFRTLGVDIDAATDIIGKLNDSGVNVQQTLSNMTLAMRFLAKGGATDLLDALGLLFEKIKEAPTDGQAFAIGAATMGRASKDLVDAIRDVDSTTGKSKLSIEDFTQSAKANGASLADQARAMETLAQKWQELKNQITATTGSFFSNELSKSITDASAIFGIVADVFKGIATQATGAKSAVRDFIDTLSGIKGLSSLIPDLGPSLLGPLGPIFKALADAPEIKGFLSRIGPDPREAKGLSLSNLPPIPGPNQGVFSLTENAISNSLDPKKTGSIGGTVHDPNSVKSVQAMLDKMLGAGGGTGAGGYEDPEYKQLSQIVRILRERVEGGKNSLAALTVEIGYLMDAMLNKPDLVQLNKDLAQVQKAIATAQAIGAPVGDIQYAKLTALQNQKATAGLDLRGAERNLGLPDPAEIASQVDLIAKSFELLSTKTGLSAGFMALAWENATAKTVADLRKVGTAVTDRQILLADWAKTMATIQTMDLGTARQVLGLTTVSQAFQATIVDAAAYAEILKAVAAGTATQLDADNAELDQLQKDKAAWASIGVALDDVSQARLNLLANQKAQNSQNTEGALAFFGIKSQADLDQAVSNIDSAFNKIMAAQALAKGNNAAVAVVAEITGGAVALPEMKVPLSDTQELILAFDKLNKKLQELRSTGGEVTADFLEKWKAASAAATLATTDLGKAMSDLGVVSVADAQKGIAQLNKELAVVKTEYGASSNEFLQAAITNYGKTIAYLQRSGQAVPAQMVADLDALKAKLLGATQTIDQAYQSLGLTRKTAAEDRLSALSASLKAIQADSDATEFAKLQASTAYWTAYYQTRINLGEEFDKKDKALNDLVAERIKLTTSDAENRWKQLSAVIGDIYKTLQSDIASGITGLINGTQSVSQAFLKMGQDIEQVIVNYVVKNLLLTQSNLNSLQQGILKLFGAAAGAAASTGGSIAGSLGGSLASGAGLAESAGGIFNAAGGIGGAVGSTAGGAGSAASGIMGALGGLSGITGIASLGVQVVSGIVSGFQQAHANAFLEEIEKHTRFMWIAIGEDQTEGISATSKKTSQKTASMLDFMNGTLTQYLQNMNIDLDTIAGKATGNFMVSIDVTPISSAISSTNELLAGISGILGGISDTAGLILDAMGSRDSGPSGSRKSARTPTTLITGIATPEVLPRPLVGPPISATINPITGNPYTTVTTTLPDTGYHLPGNDAGVPIGSSTAQLGTGSSASILNSIWAKLNTPSAENPNIDKFLSGQTFDDFLSGITDVFGGLGINAAAINTMFDTHLSQADFSTFVVPELRRDLSGILNAVGTPAGAGGQYSADQLAAISAAEIADLKDYFTNTFPQQISAIQGSLPGDIISTPIHGSEAEQLQIQQALLAQKPQLGEFPGLGVGGGPLASNAFADTPAAVVEAATQLSGALSSAGDFVVTSFTDFQRQLDQARLAGLAGYGSTYTGGIGSAVEAGSYTAAYLASQKPGYALTLPKSVTDAGSSQAIGYSSMADANRAQTAAEYSNLLNGSRTLNITINGHFPVGMSPQQVAAALAEELRTKSALLR